MWVIKGGKVQEVDLERYQKLKTKAEDGSLTEDERKEFDNSTEVIREVQGVLGVE